VSNAIVLISIALNTTSRSTVFPSLYFRSASRITSLVIPKAENNESILTVVESPSCNKVVRLTVLESVSFTNVSTDIVSVSVACNRADIATVLV
jgi:hypothetical protein